MSDYLTLNADEAAALVRAIDAPDVVRSVQLSRRDSLDNPYADGFLVVSVVTTDDQFRVAISDTGSTSAWGSSTSSAEACAACGMPYAGSHYLGCPGVE